MRGLGTASGAVTLVNALPTGVGCALAVALPVHAEVELRRDASNGSRVHIDRASDSPLVRETVNAALSRYAPGESFLGDLRVRSDVPVAKGLKSSSAVGAAVAGAILDALRQRRSAEDVARLAAEVAQQIGLSATGAYDDCLAAVRGGLAFTDNSTRTALRAPPFTLDLEAVLWIPTGVHTPSPDHLTRFRSASGEGLHVVAAARAGRWADAMTLNSRLVERLMGYDYDSLRGRLTQLGAAMAGVSGMGPTVAALVPRGRGPEFREVLATDGVEVRVAPLRRQDGAQLEGT